MSNSAQPSTSTESGPPATADVTPTTVPAPAAAPQSTEPQRDQALVEALGTLFNLLRLPAGTPLDEQQITLTLRGVLAALEQYRVPASPGTEPAPRGSSPAMELTTLMGALEDFQRTRHSFDLTEKRRQDAHQQQLARHRFVLRLVLAGVAMSLVGGSIYLYSLQNHGDTLGRWLFISAPLAVGLAMAVGLTVAAVLTKTSGSSSQEKR